jgi:AraC-like DNA-binding protein
LEKTDTRVQVNHPKRIVDPAGAAKRFTLERFAPSASLRAFVDFYWLVSWDLEGRADEVQRILPYPNTHLVFDAGRTALHGVVRGAFERTVTGKGRTLGVRFTPGGLRPFVDGPLAALTGRTVPADAMLGVPGAQAERMVLDQDGAPAMVAAAEALLLAVLPQEEPRSASAAHAVAVAAAENGPTSVAALSARVDMGERSLQRLFADYVGVSPKWVVQRFRLQEAVWRLGRPEQPDIAALAVELGFFDQAHLTRDFTRLVGRSPHEYWKSQTPRARA